MGHETQTKLQHSGNGWERPGLEIYSTEESVCWEGAQVCVDKKREGEKGFFLRIVEAGNLLK